MPFAGTWQREAVSKMLSCFPKATMRQWLLLGSTVSANSSFSGLLSPHRPSSVRQGFWLFPVCTASLAILQPKVPILRAYRHRFHLQHLISASSVSQSLRLTNAIFNPTSCCWTCKRIVPWNLIYLWFLLFYPIRLAVGVVRSSNAQGMKWEHKLEQFVWTSEEDRQLQEKQPEIPVYQTMAQTFH